MQIKASFTCLRIVVIKIIFWAKILFVHRDAYNSLSLWLYVWQLLNTMVRCSVTAPQLYLNAYHIILTNRKETTNKMKLKIHSQLDTFKRTRSKWIEVTCTFFSCCVQSNRGKCWVLHIKSWSCLLPPPFLVLVLRIPRFSIYL